MKKTVEPPISSITKICLQSESVSRKQKQKAEAESRIAQLEQHFVLEEPSKLGDIAEVGEAVTNQRPIRIQF